MSDQSEKKTKREYRKGARLTQAEYNRRSEAIKKKTHKMVRTFVPYELAEDFKQFCKYNGITVQEGIAQAMLDFLVSDKNTKE